MTPPKVFKNAYFVYFLGPFEHGKTPGDMAGRCMSNSVLGECPDTRAMICGSFVGPHCRNIGDFEVYEGI